MKQLPKTYDPTGVQAEIWDRWEQARAFHAQPDGPGRPYAIVIPPPNVTAALHLGHALNNTLQDVLVRWRRMAGDNAVWIPGTDHAGIATQTVVDKRLRSEGQPALAEHKRMEARGEAGREKFVAKVQAWKDEYEATITNQLKQMGCSCDWDRQAFTMDDARARAVREAFFQLFKDGLIYRGKRLVNWDPVTQTALADDEVEMEEVDGHFWYMKYPIIDENGRDTGAFATVATTRPETMLGDTAVAVNPEDRPRAQYIGQRVRLPIVNRILPIVGDDYVIPPDPESDDPMKKYASGFLKVTPAHDPNDYEIGRRHDLPMINVMAPDGSISKDHGWPADDFARGGEDLQNLLGLDRYEAREAIVEWFRRNDLLQNVRDYRHTVGHSYRSHVPVEPYLSDQWYVKVTDDRLAGAALRAMADAPPTSRDREGADANHTAAPLAYFITFTCYGNWLHGDDRGSVDRDHNLPGEPIMLGDEMREHRAFEKSKHSAVTLDEDRRRAVQDAIIEVCEHRGWSLLALHVRPEHVHVVVAADTTPERVMNDLKAYGTRKLRKRDLVDADALVWTRHGSTRYLNDEQGVVGACDYVVEQQGTAMAPTPVDQRDRAVAGGEGGAARIRGTRHPLPHGRGSLAEGVLRFTPARYAKTFQTWHESIRDWCISRQLWWGHRIPVWKRDAEIAFDVEPTPVEGHDNDARMIATLDRAFGGDFDVTLAKHPVQYFLTSTVHPTDQTKVRHYLCLDHDEPELLAQLEAHGWEQDPDVLDTWFSSALWPLSTLGWPDDTAELATWNPTSVLSTAREIITLWVSRMVMFNLYFRGCVPFEDVFIHAMIQDGQGRKMSKSLGNGVDPLDIIHSHGADAMRFTLVQMTTQTQDVRMPVETDPQTGRNTSPKFDLGRNFCNKLWNAGRFALEHLSSVGADDDAPPSDPGLADPASTPAPEMQALVDRWILSRLTRTIDATNAALEGYAFNVYAQTLYDFFWRDLCDWYLEAIKPIVREPGEAGERARAILAACLDASLRLLHPVVPFITEKMWENLAAIRPQRSIPGVDLPASALCIHAAWPHADPTLIDASAEAQFEAVREVVGAIRNVRNQYNVPPRQSVTVRLKAGGDAAATLEAGRDLIATLAVADVQAIGPEVTQCDDAAVAPVGAVEVIVEGLVDTEAERQRLAKRLEELNSNKAALEKRLANKGYTDKAPAHLVQQTRDQLAEAVTEIQTVQATLERLG